MSQMKLLDGLRGAVGTVLQLKTLEAAGTPDLTGIWHGIEAREGSKPLMGKGRKGYLGILEETGKARPKGKLMQRP